LRAVARTRGPEERAAAAGRRHQSGWPENGTKAGSQEYFQWFKYEFWRFVFVHQQVEKLTDPPGAEKPTSRRTPKN